MFLKILIFCFFIFLFWDWDQHSLHNSNGANHLKRKIRWTTSTIIILLSTLHYIQNIYLIFQTSTFQRPTKSNLSQQSPQKPTTTTNSNKIYNNNINHHRYTWIDRLPPLNILPWENKTFYSHPQSHPRHCWNHPLNDPMWIEHASAKMDRHPKTPTNDPIPMKLEYFVQKSKNIKCN